MAKRPQDRSAERERNTPDLGDLTDENSPLFQDDDDGTDIEASGDDDNFDQGVGDLVDDDLSEDDVDRSFDEGDEERELRGKFDENNRRDLVDRNGNVIAKAGKERKLFTDLRNGYARERAANIKLAKTLVETVKEMKTLYTRYKTLRDSRPAGDALGLSTTEQQDAMNLMALAKSDPLTALKRVLTMAHLRGIDLKTLGVQGPLDPAAVAQHVARLQAEEAAKQQKTQADREKEQRDDRNLQVQKELADFLDRNRDARGVDGRGRPLVEYVIQAKIQYPQMTLDQIWFEIKRGAQRARRRPNGGDDERRTVHSTAMRGADRPINSRRKTRGVSLEPVHPSTRWNDLAADLLRDIRADESSAR